MNLLDLFEALKPSDIPTAMRRNRLTMRDIEAERPQGAFRYRVGDREFMDLGAAEEFARGTGQRVEPIREEKHQSSTPRIERILRQLRIRYPQAKDDLEALIYSFQNSAKADRRDINRLDQENDQEESDIETIQKIIDHLRDHRAAMAEGQLQEALPRQGTPESVGYMYLSDLARTVKTKEPVTLDYGGGNRVRIVNPNTKAWFVNRFHAAKKNPEYLSAFLINMGTLEGVRALLRRMQKETGSMSDDGSQNFAEHNQKKSLQLAEDSTATTTPRTKRMVDLMRTRHPQARTDLEAILYDFMDKRKKDHQEIQDLERQHDDLEQTIKQDLEKDIASLKQRRDGRVDVSKIQAKNQQQDDAIKRIAQIQQKKDDLDQEQNQAINDLEKSAAIRPSAAAPVARPEPAPTAQAAPAPSDSVDSRSTAGLGSQQFAKMASALAGPAATPAAAPAPRAAPAPSAPAAAGKKSAKVIPIRHQIKLPLGQDQETELPLDQDQETELPLDQDQQSKIAAEGAQNINQSFAVKIARHGPNEEPVK